MFERYTDRARRIVILAQEEARLLNHNYIGTEHLVLAMLREDESTAAQALKSFALTLEDALTVVEEIIGAGDKAPTGHIPFTPRSKKVLELSLREALQLGHNYIGPEHILMGVIREGEGGGVQVLNKLSIDPAALRRKVIELLAAAPLETQSELRDAARQRLEGNKLLDAYVSVTVPGRLAEKVRSKYHLIKRGVGTRWSTDPLFGLLDQSRTIELSYGELIDDILDLTELCKLLRLEADHPIKLFLDLLNHRRLEFGAIHLPTPASDEPNPP